MKEIPVLIITNKETANLKKEIKLKNKNLIGRSKDCDIIINNPQISRHHAEIILKNNEWVLKDLNSSNGTYLNGRKIKESLLRKGDEILIPPVKLIFSYKPHQKSPLINESNKQIEYTESIPISKFLEGISPYEGKRHDYKTNFKILSSIVQTFTSNMPLNQLFKIVLNELKKIIPSQNLAIFRLKKDGNIVIKASLSEETFKYSKTIIRKAIAEKNALLVNETNNTNYKNISQSITNLNIKSVMCAPLIYKDKVLGAIYMDTTNIDEQYDKHSLQILTGIASAASTAIYSSAMYERVKKQASYLEKLNYKIMFTLANTIEARDHYTAGHTWRVTRFAEIIAKKLKWDEDKIKILRIGGVLHDIGKIGIPDYIIQKKGKLTEEEYNIMKTHAKRGALILQEAGILLKAVPYILYHHERYDGKGYPFGLKAEQIPIEGRILAVADAFDAMTSNRIYRKAMPPQKAIEILKENKGTQFDPEIVEIFCKAYEEGEINKIIQKYKNSKTTIECPFCSTLIPFNPKQTSKTYTCPICNHNYTITQDNGKPKAIRI